MEQDSQIVVAVATHKAYRMPEDPVYLPLQVGAAVHPNLDLGFAKDSAGESISNQNGEFSELTGLYWLWKNVHVPYKGLVHYRRHFKGHMAQGGCSDRFNQIATGADFREALTKADIILPKVRNYYIETIYSHYAHTFHSEQIDGLRSVLVSRQPDYVPAFDEVMRGTKAHMFNMFVMSESKFDGYCSWLFPILFELTKQLDPRSYGDDFQARYPGRVSEFSLDVWLKTNGYDYVELPVISPEPVDWVKKGTSFLGAKFLGKKYDKSF